jgi:MoxR-vWA-beta-propeller ternary system domain bpX5
VLFTLTWDQREPPLTPAAILAQGDVATRLAQRILDFTDDTRTDELRAAHNDSSLLIVGPEASLPWVEGVTYLGWDDGLLVPTTLRPNPPAYLVMRALDRINPTPPRLRAAIPGLVFVGEQMTLDIDVIRLRGLFVVADATAGAALGVPQP